MRGDGIGSDSEAAKDAAPVLTFFMKGVTHTGDPAVVTGLCLLAVMMPGTRKTIAFPVCAAVVLSSILYVALKITFAIDRSDIIKLIVSRAY